MSDETITTPTAADYSLNPQSSYFGTKARIKVKASCLNQNKTMYDHGKIIKIHIVYEISKNYDMNCYPALEICLFGAVELIKNADIDKYKYFGYGIVFDRKGFCSHLSGGSGRNVKWKLLKTLKYDSKNWKRKTQHFVNNLKKTSWKL